MQTNKKPRFIKPPNKLKAKMGAGGIDESLIIKAQDYIEKVEIDFSSIAVGFLAEIKAELKVTGKSPSAKIINAIMQLKGNGGMFRYQLISEIADSALNFIENIDVVNKDAIQVIKAHVNTMEVIIASKLTGDAGSQGFALVKELNQACNRYFKKHPPEQ